MKQRGEMALAGVTHAVGYFSDRQIGFAQQRLRARHPARDQVLMRRDTGRLLEDVGRNIAACPDTGNWVSNEVRYKGLALTFPKAVTCDFKARELGPEGQHAAYDLKRCFTIGWEAGFRGPWCL